MWGICTRTTHGARWSLFSSPLLFALSCNPQFSEKVLLLGENMESFDIEVTPLSYLCALIISRQSTSLWISRFLCLSCSLWLKVILSTPTRSSTNPNMLLPEMLLVSQSMMGKIVADRGGRGAIAKSCCYTGKKCAQEMVKTQPSIRLAMTSSPTKKETEKVVNALTSVLAKIVGKRGWIRFCCTVIHHTVSFNFKNIAFLTFLVLFSAKWALTIKTNQIRRLRNISWFGPLSYGTLVYIFIYTSVVTASWYRRRKGILATATSQCNIVR